MPLRLVLIAFVALTFACDPDRLAATTTDLEPSPSQDASPGALDAPPPDAAAWRGDGSPDGPVLGQPCEPGRVACPAGQKCCATCCPWRFVCLLPVTSSGCPRSWDDEPWDPDLV